MSERGANEVPAAFKYVLGEKEDVVLCLFYGKLGAREVPILEQAEKELKDKPQGLILLAFRDLESFNPGAHQAFVQFQKALRDSGKLLGLCSLRPEVKKILMALGMIRDAEIFNNIPDAWKG